MVFGVAHVFASFNDTFVHVTDPSGRETLVKVTGGMKVKADRDEASPACTSRCAQREETAPRRRGRARSLRFGRLRALASRLAALRMSRRSPLTPPGAPL